MSVTSSKGIHKHEMEGNDGYTHHCNQERGPTGLSGGSCSLSDYSTSQLIPTTGTGIDISLEESRETGVALFEYPAD